MAYKRGGARTGEGGFDAKGFGWYCEPLDDATERRTLRRLVHVFSAVVFIAVVPLLLPALLKKYEDSSRERLPAFFAAYLTRARWLGTLRICRIVHLESSIIRPRRSNHAQIHSCKPRCSAQ
jgi:hypothetical protein